jgi:CheY-like chemotaxis protein
MPVLLIVEDESVLRSSMVRGLSKLPDLAIVEAGTVKQALMLLQSARPSIVVSDLDLPDGSGIEILSAMDQLSLRAPLIYISAYLDKYRSRIPARADIDLCEKPIRLDALRQLIQARLSAHRVDDGSPFTLEEYIQLSCIGAHSILIRVESEHRLLGRIVIRAGEVWSAEDAQGVGEDALRRLLMRESARVVCETLRAEAGERNIGAQPWFGLLLEAARKRDERGRDEMSRMIDEEIARSAFLSAAPPSLPPSPPIPAPPPSPAADLSQDASFDELLSQGVEAALVRDYPSALRAFRAADAVRPNDPIVTANIRRLEKLGIRV